MCTLTDGRSREPVAWPEQFSIVHLHAGGADPVREVGVRVLLDVDLDVLPGALVSADALAVRAHWDDAPERSEFCQRHSGRCRSACSRCHAANWVRL